MGWRGQAGAGRVGGEQAADGGSTGWLGMLSTPKLCIASAVPAAASQHKPARTRSAWWSAATLSRQRQGHCRRAPSACEGCLARRSATTLGDVRGQHCPSLSSYSLCTPWRQRLRTPPACRAPKNSTPSVAAWTRQPRGARGRRRIRPRSPCAVRSNVHKSQIHPSPFGLGAARSCKAALAPVLLLLPPR